MNFISSHERVVKEVAVRGNSGGVYLPRSWVGRRVLIQPLDIGDYVLDALSPCLKDVCGVYIYGSYARGEASESSDLDVLIVSDKDINVKEGGFLDITVSSLAQLRDKIRRDPVGYYSIIQEALPVINEPLLRELQGIKPAKKNLLRYYRDTRDILSIVRGLLDYEGDDSGCVYSVILRLRGLYLIWCGLRGERYSTERLEEYVTGKGIPLNVFREMYSVYRARRDDKPVKTKIPREDIEKLYKIVSDLLCELENAE